MAQQFSEIVNQFSADIYQNCIDGKSSNVILSPLSIQTALSLAMMGAKGTTAKEMSTIMKFGSISRDDVAKHFQTFMTELHKSSSVKLANKIYIKKEYVVKKSFGDIATKQFNSEAENVDFNQSQAAVDNINQWVESKTNDKIKNLLDASMVDSMTRMVLVNAIYFKGSWASPFKPENTNKQPFWLNETESVEVDMMYQKSKYKHGEFPELDACAVEMPYENSDISMFIILPNKRDGLPKLEAELNKINLNELSTKMWKLDVELSLPKFKVEFKVGLKDILTKMGMGTMFSDSADFSDLLESPEPLQVSDVIHKAFIEVNEEGAEAAAATGMIMMAMCMPPPPRNFLVNHPFIYMLRDTKANTSVFVGRINHLNK